ncbi:kinase-like protein [Roridomyces roridus]|uniref:Kinase-like protein n=1 Tax=Roridomyces roridus TaxID=1738132 RepID=A0AAD7BHW5_9AGAR|nr:kinase-like protein [Roridomyces roridus]
MSTPWAKRKARLRALLKNPQDDLAEGLALDRILHGQNVIGKTAKTTEIDELRFHDADLQVLGMLEQGQFGVIDVVKCRLDGRVYVRKSIEKRFALRTREQCSPQFERDILLRARTTESVWAPHLLSAFQTPTHLNLVMEYASGGTLWDVLESNLNGRISEEDMAWWTPQVISAVHWCHTQGFAHRDIKPHNFVLTPDARILLIDFGTAAPLAEGGRIPKQYCLVPCGTCDYISPEILNAHEQALLALEMDDRPEEPYGYGFEIDWWSLGAMLYELVYGAAPFFATDIGTTYLRIMDHEKSLKFAASVPVSAVFRDLLRRFLTRADRRLGRRGLYEIMDHPAFVEVNWTTLASELPPPDLHLPQFTYADPPSAADDSVSQSHSKPFAFSALFQSSPMSGSEAPQVSNSNVDSTPLRGSTSSRSRSLTPSDDAFIGFSWGPPEQAFPSVPELLAPPEEPAAPFATPRPARLLAVPLATPIPNRTPRVHSYPGFMTPIRPSAGGAPTTMGGSTVRRRAVSDREAMKQLADCVQMSARKKVMESGRKPRVLVSHPSSGSFKSGSIKVKGRPLPLPSVPDFASSSQGRLRPAIAIPALPALDGNTDTESESTGPPSPSPSPRPGSAMSRRSGTPTLTLTGTYHSQRTVSGAGNVSLNLPRIRAVAAGGRGRAESAPPAIATPMVMAVSTPSFENTTFDELEDKHAAMMDEIRRIQDRLDRFSRDAKRPVGVER